MLEMIAAHISYIPCAAISRVPYVAGFCGLKHDWKRIREQRMRWWTVMLCVPPLETNRIILVIRNERGRNIHLIKIPGAGVSVFMRNILQKHTGSDLGCHQLTTWLTAMSIDVMGALGQGQYRLHCQYIAHITRF